MDIAKDSVGPGAGDRARERVGQEGDSMVMGQRSWWSLVMVLGLAAWCQGAVSLPAESVEAQAVSADVVVRGEVVEIVAADPSGQGAVEAGEDWEIPRWYRVTVNAREVVKGPPGKVVFYASSWGRDEAVWQALWAAGETGEEALFFLWTGARAGGYDGRFNPIPLTLPRSSWEGGIIPLGPGEGSPVLSAELRELTSGADVMAAVRRYAALPTRAPMRTLVVPYALHGGAAMRGPYSTRVPPADARMRGTARAWARSADVTMRWDAVQVLADVARPTATDVEAVRHVAGAPVESVEGAVTQEMAMEVLNGWGSPVVDKGVQRSVPVSRPLLALSVGAVLSAWGGRVWWVRRARAGRGAGGRRTTVLVVACAVLGVLWGRSYVERDGLSIGRWEVGCWDGEVCAVYRSRPDVGAWRPLRWCRSEDLWAVRAYRWDPTWGYQRAKAWPWLTVASGGYRAWPTWTWLVGTAVPFWFMLAGIGGMKLVAFLNSVVWAAVRPGRRGFPVVVGERETTVESAA